MKKKNNNRAYAIALYEVVKGLKGDKMNRVVRSFVGLLARDHKLKQAPRIIAEFERYSKKQEGLVEVTIKSARPLKSEVLGKIVKALGGKVEETMEIDESLIGGVVVATEDRILDASIKTQLKNLQLALSNSK